MAIQLERYTLFGFSQELDWKPLHFVDPIPAHRICDVCGLLPNKSIFLPCRHVLCRKCYEQCLVDEAYECPLDGLQFREEDADWRMFPLENLLRRKVKCWNEKNGCDAIMKASDILKHFDEDCIHHSTRCPKCSSFVLWRNMCEHRRRNCLADVSPNQAQRLEPSNDSVQEAMLSALEAILEERVGEMRICLDQLVRDQNTHSDRLNEVSHVVNGLKETVIETTENQTREANKARVAVVRGVKEDLTASSVKLDEVSQRIGALGEDVKVVAADATRQCLEKLEQSSAEFRRRLDRDDEQMEKVSQSMSAFECIIGKALERATETIVQKCKTHIDLSAASRASERECGRRALDGIENHPLGPNTLNFKSYKFYVQGVKTLEEQAMSLGCVKYCGDPIYLCGYRIIPGIYLQRHLESVSLQMRLQLCKGAMHKYLKWPHTHAIKVTFLHPSSNETEEFFREVAYNMPTDSRNPDIICNALLSLKDLEVKGYVESDVLCVKYEILPP